MRDKNKKVTAVSLLRESFGMVFAVTVLIVGLIVLNELFLSDSIDTEKTPTITDTEKKPIIIDKKKIHTIIDKVTSDALAPILVGVMFVNLDRYYKNIEAVEKANDLKKIRKRRKGRKKVCV
ncbi:MULTISPECIES: hypothetical protein [Vagococcus]|uniref:Uncharacterized protein n=1 Tax=Vagococcus fluvialis bH819 TaxID=1255619 RepID=A0A1X6WS46_9ENTE|nr:MULTISPECIES: hypothetical protein [Vagococcus]SLM87120.1 hypothetical protein FM121_13560 [Vagococcus fluvialis bH819]HCM90601.1 hypothetical protein [Vagococcus sp.]